jgi:hypothetical protein
MKSHIQVNINKVLEYLRGIGKFNTRHLWSNNEIAAADMIVVWELLDDIWHFYSHKVNKTITNNSKAFRNTQQEIIKKKFESLDKTNFTSNNICPQEPTPYSQIYNENLPKMKVITGLDNYSEINNYNKIITKTITKDSPPHFKEYSNIKNVNNNSNLDIKNLNTTSNLTVIANCLGIDNKKAIRKVTGPKKIDFKNNVAENTKILRTENSASKLRTIENTIPRLRRNINSINNTPRKCESATKDKSDCFIIFNKNNVKKLKKELEEFESIPKKIETSFNNMNFSFDKKEHQETFSPINIISTEETQKRQYTQLPDNKYGTKLKDWLITLGIKEVSECNFDREEILAFKDGILLSNIVSILEGKKILGINTIPRSNTACLKNISKSLEVLRIKKVFQF